MTKQVIIKIVALVIFVLSISLTTVVVASNNNSDDLSSPAISEVYIPSESTSTTTTKTETVEEVSSTVEETTIEEITTVETTIATEVITTEEIITTIVEDTSKAEEEYPVATQVWKYMRNEFGWSETVCAGIIGNLMAECGGCWTSDLNWSISSSHGKGMIQWIGGRKAQLIEKYGENPSIEEQLCFMKDELYGTNGVTKQVTDWQLNEIMNAENPADCAYAFASYFERCATQYRWQRREYADRAYEEFHGLN